MPFSLLKKIYKRVFSIFSLKLVFILSFFIFSSNILLLAQANTDTIKVENASLPCSLYDDNDWGVSWIDAGVTSVGAGKGLFDVNNGGLGPFGGLNGGTEKPLLQKIYEVFHKDPIFFPLGSAVNLNVDPILGVKEKTLQVGTTPILDPTIVQLPCKYGQLSGLISRIIPNGLNDAIDVSKNRTKFSNCDGPMPYSYLCEKDNRISNNSVGGCPINLLYSKELDSIQDTSSNNDTHNKLAPYIGGLERGNETGALDNSIIRLIYSPKSVLKKTDGSKHDNSDGIKSDRYNSFLSAAKNYISEFESNASTSSTYLSELNSDKLVKYSGNNNDVIYDSAGHKLLKNDYLAYNSPNDSKVGRWFDTTASPNIPIGAYFENPKVYNDLDKSSFECFAVTTKNKNNQANFTFYQWMPISTDQLSSPSCESVGVNASATIESTTATGKKILICTPCIVPSLFQTDIFGQPVYGLPTGIGCLPTSLNGIIAVIIRIGTMTAGGIALFIITLSGIKIALNAGNPDEVKKAQKGISSAVLGLLVIICSVLLLNVVGVRILDLSSFGGNEVNFATTGTGTP